MSKLVMSVETKRTKLIVGIDYGTTFSGMFCLDRALQKLMKETGIAFIHSTASDFKGIKPYTAWPGALEIIMTISRRLLPNTLTRVRMQTLLGMHGVRSSARYEKLFLYKAAPRPKCFEIRERRSRASESSSRWSNEASTRQNRERCR
jgi:hypothetical protein